MKTEMRVHTRYPILIACCSGCDKVEGNFCSAYVYPAGWWEKGGCPLASHVVARSTKNAQGKTRAGQQKQKKRL